MMRRLLCLAATALLLTACGSSKKLTYLQDIDPGDIAQVNSYTNIIKPSDLLSIVVSSSKPELALPFNLYSVRAQLSAVQQTSQRQELEGYTVTTDGTIDFPSLGELHVAGMTRSQLAEDLKERLSNYMPNPIVTINFLNFNISVIGEVYHPGNFKITGDRVSILEALGLAGDLTEFGNREKVLVIRENNGIREIGELNLKTKRIFDSPFYYLQQNDVVVVQPTSAKARKSSTFQMNFQSIVSLSSLVSSIAMLVFYISSLKR